METINKQEYIEYPQSLLIASYTMRPTPFRNMEDGLEETVTNRGQDKNQARADVRQMLGLRKTLMRFLKKIVEEGLQNSATDKN